MFFKSVNKGAKGKGGPGRCESRERARKTARDEEDAVIKRGEASI
jgi:hypothetical protein